MQPTEDKIKKLPKWAQEYIRTLEMQKTELECRVDDVYNTNPDETNVFIEDGIKNQPLPNDSGIVFKMTDINTKRHPREEIRVKIDTDGNLQIMGGNTISIYPQAANMVRVKIK